ncbi:MAG: sigma-54 dependent transcriptional regulator [Vicinamibacterales bacterium]
MTGPTHRQPVRLIGQTEAIRTLEADIARAAQSDAKVLITGETGVGKEVVSRLIHQQSARSQQSLVTLNCAGLPDGLLESELFGHARGSFTGAYRDKPGLLETAPGGTVFLDEVGEMSTRMQVVLLRFLETGEIQRVGGDGTTLRVDVRLVTATNRDLRAEVEAGRFREDLYFRLNVIHIVVPPLRERAGDIPLLIEHFLDAYSRQHRLPRAEASADAMERLVAYRWPGNVRELKNVVERMVLKAGGRAIRPVDLPPELVRPIASAPAAPVAQTQPGTVPRSVADDLTALMVKHGESFWSAVYPLFMARDLTRADLRRVVEFGLEKTNGNYRQLVQLFNMPNEDYKRFLSFLRKHDCHLPFQRFRAATARPQSSRALRVVK